MAFATSIHFQNYRAFRDAILPLAPLTVLIGPNGSGKTSALSAVWTMAAIARNEHVPPQPLAPIGVVAAGPTLPRLEVTWDNRAVTRFNWDPNRPPQAVSGNDPIAPLHLGRLQSGRVYTLDMAQIGATVPLSKTTQIQENGVGLPAVLTTLQDQSPERFEALNLDLRRWMPEFDRILFDTPSQGQRAIQLRTSIGGHVVPTSKLSTGTLLSLALLTLCHLPSPPWIVGLEEPDHAIHPALLRKLKDSLLRLTSPQTFDDAREPVQVIITTHSPYLVDLFHDELESVVLVHKQGLYSTFTRLSDLPNVTDIVKDAALGDTWYSGVLGGVPAEA